MWTLQLGAQQNFVNTVNIWDFLMVLEVVIAGDRDDFAVKPWFYNLVSVPHILPS